MKNDDKKINLLKDIILKNIFLESEFLERTSKEVVEKITEIAIERGYVYEQKNRDLNLIVTYRIFLEGEKKRIAYYVLTFREIFETGIDFENFSKNKRAKKYFLKNFVDDVLWPYIRIYLDEILMKAALPNIVLPLSIGNHQIDSQDNKL
jgi:preprotein translocase subunit SecB